VSERGQGSVNVSALNVDFIAVQTSTPIRSNGALRDPFWPGFCLWSLLPEVHFVLPGYYVFILASLGPLSANYWPQSDVRPKLRYFDFWWTTCRFAVTANCRRLTSKFIV